MKHRIWELDAFRGICILGVIVVHFVYDINALYALVDWDLPDTFLFIQRWGGVLFLLLSGICATLGSRSVRRGFIVLGSGLVISLVTTGMYLLKLQGIGIIIYFGVLHCLGVCMILWPLLRKLPWWAVALVGAVLVAAGFWIDTLPPTDTNWLLALGLHREDFLTSDYFPLLPNFGFFLLGAALGRTLYRRQETLLPKVNARNPVLRFLQFCGRQSLWIYLLHQPILNGICWVWMAVK